MRFLTIATKGLRVARVPVRRAFSTAKEEEVNEAKEEVKEGPTALELKEQELAQLKNSYLHCLADMENLRARTRKEVLQASQFSIQSFAKDLLTTSDTLDIALSQTPPSLLALTPDTEALKSLQALHHGIVLTQKSLQGTFARFEISGFGVAGEKFDPMRHEALFRGKVEGREEGEVYVVSQGGYMIGGRVLRAAKVGVVQGDDE